MLTLICGLPNSGKSTLSEQYPNVIHLDDVMSYRKVAEMVSTSDDVTVEGIYIIHQTRRELANAYKGDKKVCIWLDVPMEECLARENRGRSKLFIRNCAMLFEPPTYDEGWNEIVVMRGE